jgi:ComF family protein
MIKNFLLNLFFPKFCFLCQKEGTYLCEDCKSTLEILHSHQSYSGKNLKDLYWAAPYSSVLIEKLIHNFKYKPFIKGLSRPLSSLIINHFQLIEKKPNFVDFVIIPIPLHKKRLKWRGFNQAEEIGKELSRFLKIPLLKDCLIKIKESLPQIELSEEERKENVLGTFLVKNREKVKKRKILLVDDVYTTGATMEECARILKKAGAREVIGIVVARG